MPSLYRDGATYDRISAPLERIGREVLDRLILNGHETVLDAGCGSGRVTQALAQRVPEGHVIGVDGSVEMIAAARARLGPEVELMVADLERLDLGERRVDAVLSTATFHWIRDHDNLFSRLRAIMRPGAQLAAQCGGHGNTPELLEATTAVGERAPFSAHFAGWVGPWTYPTPEQTLDRLQHAGFTETSAWLEPKPAPYEDLEQWLRTNALTAHIARLPVELREPYVQAVLAQLDPSAPTTYIRLNIDAVAV
jgi:trans-aconitate 2-methyltransferase